MSALCSHPTHTRMETQRIERRGSQQFRVVGGSRFSLRQASKIWLLLSDCWPVSARRKALMLGTPHCLADDEIAPYV